MSDFMKKRPRKSKLVPRDVNDTVDDNIVNLEGSSNEEVIKIEEDPDSSVAGILSKQNIQFSVKVQVEKCTDNVVIPSDVEKRYQQSEILNYEFSKYLKIIESNTLNVADKNLVLHLKNYMGKKLKCPPQSRENKLLEDALVKWSHWQTFNRLREEPLCYKCYVCNKAWWYMYPFREHLTEHLEPTLIVNIETSHQICHIIAHIDSAPEFKLIEIDSFCLKCNMNYEYHTKLLLCKFCQTHFYTCKTLRNHEMICNSRKLAVENISSAVCKLCDLNCGSDQQLDDHMVLSHTVRSDVPMAIKVRFCSDCDDKYIMHTVHPCSKRIDTIACEGCNRKFPNKYLLKIHKLYETVNVLCGICTTIVPKQCLIISHWLKHSEHFVYAIRCLLCPDIYCPNEYSIKEHKKNFHKFFKKTTYFEKVVVPKQCIEKFNNSDPNVFLYDGTSSNIYKYHNKRRGSVEKEDENVDFLTLNGSIFQDSNAVVVKEEPMEIDDQASRDIDMESMITRNEIKKEIDDNSQTVEETAHRSLEPTTDSQQTDESVHGIKREIIDEGYEAASTIAATEEEADDNDAFGEFIIKIEENWDSESNVHRKANIENESSDDDEHRLVIKEEPLDDCDDDLIVLNAGIVSGSELDTSNTDERDGDARQNVNIDPEKLMKAGYKKRKVYKCLKCHYQGYHREYKRHVSTHGGKRDLAAAADDDDDDYDATGRGDSGDRFPCAECGRRYATLRKYLSHLKRHGVPRSACAACGMRMGDATALQAHVRGHVAGQYVKVYRLVAGQTSSHHSYRCKRCDAAVQRDDFFEHWQTHLWDRDSAAARGQRERAEARAGDGERDAPKPIGNETLLCRVLDQLTAVTTAKSSYRLCIVCNKQFSRYNECKRHLIEHLLANAFAAMGKNGGLECPLCKHVSLKADKYRFHMRNHASLPVYQCSICNKVFSDSSNFTKHKKVHNIGVHVCDVCKKKFQAKASLEKHLMAHEHGPNPCMECGKVFYLLTDLKRHMRKFHRKTEVRYRCCVCQAQFPTLRLRWDHQWEAHKIRNFKADCELCTQSFRKYADLKSHLRSVHGVACPGRGELEARRSGAGGDKGKERKTKLGDERQEVSGKDPRICIVKCDANTTQLSE